MNPLFFENTVDDFFLFFKEFSLCWTKRKIKSFYCYKLFILSSSVYLSTLSILLGDSESGE